MRHAPFPDPTPPRLLMEHVTVDFGSLRAVDDLTLEIGAGEVVCLLGPSGCGKTTTLRVAAGVERQTRGKVGVDGRPVSGDRQHLPPEARSIGLMFQDFALFPHLSVADNVAFGLRRGARRGADGRMVSDYLDRVGLAGYGAKYPHQLSGGEQQRVALARALAPRPRVMLMDEPFSSLDNRLRDEVRDETLAILKEEGTAVLLVTHEPDEAMRMADRIAVMRRGRVVQIGAPYHIYNQPADREVAAFFSDLNVIDAVVRDRQTDTPFGRFLTPNLDEGLWVEIAVRPQHLEIRADDGRADPQEHGVTALGRVVRARFMGAASLIEVAMEHDGSQLRATVPYAWLPEKGTPVRLSMRRDRCFIFAAAERDHAPAAAST